MFATKIGENTTNIWNCYFTINLHFIISNKTLTYRKLCLPLASSISLVFLPLEMQKGLKQTKVYDTFFYFVWKEMTHKPLKVAAVETLFSRVYVIGTACFDECVYFLWYLQDITFYKSLPVLSDFFNRHVTAFFEASLLKELHILCVISTISVQC